MKQFKFSLEKYHGASSRHICPNCGKKEFVRYVNNETEEYLEEYVGKCNRIEKCGYHYTPKQYFDDKGEKVQFFTRKNVHVEEKSTYYYNEKLVLDSLHSDTKKSNLYQFLIQYFHEEKVKNTLKKYLVGVSNFWQDAVIFWQIDRDFKVRSGKVMQYDLITGNRDKTKHFWIHRISRTGNYIHVDETLYALVNGSTRNTTFFSHIFKGHTCILSYDSQYFTI